MPKYHECDQYSGDWERLRLGIPTSSQFDKILTPAGKPSAQWKKYACQLVAEKLLNRPVETYTSPFMERGSELESDAVEFYELLHDVKTKRIGFITTDDDLVGCSPDRLVGDDGLLEIKVPSPVTLVQYMITGDLDKTYWPQLQGQLYVSGRKWVDICAWHPELQPVITRVVRDEAYIGCLESQLWEFNTFLREVMAKIMEMHNIKPEERNADVPTTLRF